MLLVVRSQFVLKSIHTNYGQLVLIFRPVRTQLVLLPSIRTYFEQFILILDNSYLFGSIRRLALFYYFIKLKLFNAFKCFHTVKWFQKVCLCTVFFSHIFVGSFYLQLYSVNRSFLLLSFFHYFYSHIYDHLSVIIYQERKERKNE